LRRAEQMASGWPRAAGCTGAAGAAAGSALVVGASLRERSGRVEGRRVWPAPIGPCAAVTAALACRRRRLPAARAVPPRGGVAGSPAGTAGSDRACCAGKQTSGSGGYTFVGMRQPLGQAKRAHVPAQPFDAQTSAQDGALLLWWRPPPTRSRTCLLAASRPPSSTSKRTKRADVDPRGGHAWVTSGGRLAELGSSPPRGFPRIRPRAGTSYSPSHAHNGADAVAAKFPYVAFDAGRGLCRPSCHRPRRTRCEIGGPCQPVWPRLGLVSGAGRGPCVTHQRASRTGGIGDKAAHCEGPLSVRSPMAHPRTAAHSRPSQPLLVVFSHRPVRNSQWRY